MTPVPLYITFGVIWRFLRRRCSGPVLCVRPSFVTTSNMVKTELWTELVYLREMNCEMKCSSICMETTRTDTYIQVPDIMDSHDENAAR